VAREARDKRRLIWPTRRKGNAGGKPAARGITREGRRREATPLNADLIPRISFVFLLGPKKLCSFSKVKTSTTQKHLSFNNRKNLNTNQYTKKY